MLELKNIVKIYPTGNEDVTALKGVDLRFRDNEFVSVLGPSGCGKTTMLNIIGGLDGYTSGDLVINGRSTKEYKDRDWDNYRNHSIGFVFQSYNLIPHQTVLANVELALTLSGVPKKERRRRAKEALELVGLGDQLKKRPAEMSGGQMQRVAIARAIVNDPDIVLADEPTGALDTETGIQVMEILKEISKDRLVIMVTHNPELAEKYSTRIVRMLDGKITDDSLPVTDEEMSASLADISQKEADLPRKKVKKPSMSFFTAFSLSLRNLITKKSRTILTSFAGSIGIIGIALIYAVSSGTTAFIASIQEETLSSYPLTIEEQTVDLTSLINTFTGRADSVSEHENDAVYQKAMLYKLVNALGEVETQENDLKAFKKFIDEERAKPDGKLTGALSGVQYGYNFDLLVYTENVDGDITIADVNALTTELMYEYYGIEPNDSMTQLAASSSYSSSSLMRSSSALMREIVPGDDGKTINRVTENQYEIVTGRWPKEYNEIVLFLDEKNELSDMTLYALGLKPAEEIKSLVRAAADHKTVEYVPQSWSYEEVMALDLRAVLNADCYTYNEISGVYTDLREVPEGLKFLYDNAIKLKIVGIVKPSPDAVSASSNGGVGYTYKLTEYVVEHTKNAQSVQAQESDKTTDIFSGLPFRDDGSMTDEEKSAAFREYVAGLDTEAKAEVFVKISSIPPEDSVTAFVSSTLENMTREQIENLLIPAMASQTGMSEDTIRDYVAGMSDENINKLITEAVKKQFIERYAAMAEARFADMTEEELAAALDASMPMYVDADLANYYDNVIEFSNSTYENNMKTLGVVDLDKPSEIHLYASSFQDKDVIEEVIAEYNENVSETEEIKYTDYVGIIMSSVTTIINAITYVLIGFVSVSLVVSSIMIGVITLISVQERTKEIGILRAIGASKRNVSAMFNAETVIVGFASGLLGVAITYLLCLPINLILHALTEMNNLSAFLPPLTAVILIAISVLLTLIAGIIPSRSAAKKDPVVALRTE
ncbi:MAG: ATP-binding cassette domain-containing protein [Clostridia bacterium]|nr:ATP-binding cassette domain-containing protein [Clostridia bacterium]